MANTRKDRKNCVRNVDIVHPETGVLHRFEAGDEIPGDLADLVDNPAVFEEEDSVPASMRPIDKREWIGVGEDEVEENFDGDDDGDDRYLLLTVGELLDEVRTRGLDVDSTDKQDLVEALRAHDDGEDSPPRRRRKSSKKPAAEVVDE